MTGLSQVIDGRLVASLLVWSVLLLFLALTGLIMKPFLASIGWALIIGIATFPLYRRLRTRLGGNDTKAALVMMLGVVLTIIVPLSGLIYLLTLEIPATYAIFEQLAAGGARDIIADIMTHPAIAPWLARLQPYLGQVDLTVTDSVLPLAKQGLAFLLGYTTWFLKNSLFVLFKVAVMIFILTFVYRDGERVRDRLRQVLPLTGPEWDLLAGTVNRVLSAVLFGIFFTCIVQGTLGGIGFWFTGLPTPILFGVVMTACAIIPAVGTALIWVPGAVALFLQGETMYGIIMLAWGAGVVGSIDNVIRPIFISGRGHIPLLVTGLGGIGGLVTFGLIGLVAGPLMLSLLIDLVTIAAGRREEAMNGS
jgi:predicted PurR-regulated permease PerM